MSKRASIWLVVVFVILVCAGWFIYKQWNNISAIIDSFRYSQEDVVKKIEETKDSVQKYIDENEDITVRDLTEDEANALNEGSLTEEEVISILTGQTKNPEKTESNQVTTSKPDSGNEVQNPKPVENNPPAEPEKTSSQIVAEAIAKLYIQKNNYLNKLDNIEAHVRQIYIDMPKEEKKGAKQRLLKEYLPQVASWESECDSVVYGILEEIRAAVKESGQSEEIVTKLEEAYLNEKKLKKSYFINRYMD